MNTSTSQPALKRSNKPIFWSLFGAGGMVSALTGPMVVAMLLIAAPLGILISPQVLSFAKVSAFVHLWPVKLVLLALICLYLFHAFHRFYHTLHDFGVHVGPGIKAACHGAAALLTVYGAMLLLRL